MNHGAPAAITTRSGWARSKMRSPARSASAWSTTAATAGDRSDVTVGTLGPPAARAGASGPHRPGRRRRERPGRRPRRRPPARWSGRRSAPSGAARRGPTPARPRPGRARSGRGPGVDAGPRRRASRCAIVHPPAVGHGEPLAAGALPGLHVEHVGEVGRRGRSGASIGARRPTGSAARTSWRRPPATHRLRGHAPRAAGVVTVVHPADDHRRQRRRAPSTPAPRCGPSTSDTSRRERWRRSSWTSPWVGAHICPPSSLIAKVRPSTSTSWWRSTGGNGVGVGVERIGHRHEVWLLDQPVRLGMGADTRPGGGMPSSVFDVICPACGGDMELSAPGEGRCRPCGAAYLVRMRPPHPRPHRAVARHPARPIEGWRRMRIAQIAPLYEAVPPAALRRHRARHRRPVRRAGRAGPRRHACSRPALLDDAGPAASPSGLPAAGADEPPRAGRGGPAPPPAHARPTSTSRPTSSTSSTRTWTCGRSPSPCASATPSVLTMHGRLDTPYVQAILPLYPDVPLVSVSDSQRAPAAGPAAPVGRPPSTTASTSGATARHAREPATTSPSWDGSAPRRARSSPSRSPAERAGRCASAPRSTPWTSTTSSDEVEPLLGADVSFVGEVDERQKPAFFGGAAATLFPSDWPEPFGLVMIESLAAGTPVVALRRGAVPEVLVDGVTGFICDDVDEMVAAVGRLDEIDPQDCRARRAPVQRRRDVRRLRRRLPISRRLHRAPRGGHEPQSWGNRPPVGSRLVARSKPRSSGTRPDRATAGWGAVA